MSKKTTQLFLFGITLLFLGYIVGTVTVGCSTASKVKQYKVLDINEPNIATPKQLQAELIQLVGQGWELEEMGVVNNRASVAIFKR